MKALRTLDESKLFARLKSAQTSDSTARDQLAGNVRWVVDHAQIIGDQIIRRLPQYTLHQGTHFFNVLSIMEELLPEETLQRLMPLECALCILAAFLHDIGMVMPDAKIQKYLETQDTAENREWLRHRDGYPEELRQIERWKKVRDEACRNNDPVREAEAERRVGYLEGYLLAEFIRKRHAADTRPILYWLTRLEEEAKNQTLFRYGNFNFKHYLAQVGASHGQRVSWLREMLVQSDKPDRFFRLAGGEHVNLAFPGLLVRLADIMDFDATRAPGILYKHFGIENAVSILEWNKHMAITGWSFDDEALTYEADECQHPVYEKAIRKFISDIEREVMRAREELNWQQRLLGRKGDHYQIRLPEAVQTRIHPACNDEGRPLYVFHDLQFELDQHEIQQLLLGESLYADPTLCLRELIQNSLDALQMRDLRLKVLAKNPDARVEPTDGLRPGEELHAEVTWGHDPQTDREYICVWDNGCGMTREVLERFFTKLGKSYYRSPEYEREQQILREHGYIVSPISQFGIGFLSCFMLADEVRVRTRPSKSDDRERSAYDVRISGPGSLFWLAPGTLERQGTEVILYLKPSFQLDHDYERAIRWLREDFRYSERTYKTRTENQKHIDPFWIVGRYAIWPMFPILLRPESGGKPAIRLDDRFHWDVLAPIDIEAVIKKAAEWDFPASAIGQPGWECLDWVDDQGNKATGTRIRLIFPYHQSVGDIALPLDPPPDKNLVRAHELAAFVETTLEDSQRRTHLTVKGIGVDGIAEDERDVCSKMLPVAAGVGTRLWVDLRGAAAPRLTADRKQVMPRSDIDDWPGTFRGVFQRWCGWLQAHLNKYSSQLASGLLSTLAVKAELRPIAPATSGIEEWELKAVHQSAAWTGEWLRSLLIQEITTVSSLRRDPYIFDALEYDSNREREHDLDFNTAFNHARAHALARDIICTPNVALDLVLARVFAFDLVCARVFDDYDFGRIHNFDLELTLLLAFYFDRDLKLSRDLTHGLALAHTSSHIRDFERAFSETDVYACWRLSLVLHLLPEAFADDLSHSLPALGVCGLKGCAGDGWLIAPGHIEWDVDAETAQVCRDSTREKWSSALQEMGYDLVFPLTNVPLGRLRRDCAEWRSGQSPRALGTLAFFLNAEKFFAHHNHQFLSLFKAPQIHALMPKPDLWLKPFDDWTEEDWKTCGLSALWDIESGQVYWAEGAHKAEDMPRLGKPIKEFITSMAEQNSAKE